MDGRAGSARLPAGSGYTGVHSVIIQQSANLFCALFCEYSTSHNKKRQETNPPRQLSRAQVCPQASGQGWGCLWSSLWASWSPMYSLVRARAPGSPFSVLQPPLDMKAHLPSSRATLERLGVQTQLGAWPLVQHKRTWAFQAPAHLRCRPPDPWASCLAQGCCSAISDGREDAIQHPLTHHTRSLPPCTTSA